MARDTSLYTLMRELAHGLFAGSGLLPTVLGRTTTKGAVGSLVDGSRLLYENSDAGLLNGRYVYLHRITGVATAGAAATLTTDKDFLLNELASFTIKVVGGTGIGQTRTVSSNTAGPNTVITVSANWDTNPDATTEYELYPASDHVRISRVKKNGLTPATGAIALSPDMQVTVESGADFSLHLFNPAFLIQAIVWALGRMKYRALLSVGWIPDGDMEDPGVTHWTSEGAATVTKEDVVDSEVGRQRLKVVASAADKGANSDAILATAGEPYAYAALVLVESGPGSVDAILTDVDGSDFETVNLESRQFVEVRVTGSIPTGCERIRADFVSNGGACTFYVIYSSFLFPNRDRVALDRFDNKGQILEVLRLPQGSAAVVTNTYLPLSHKLEPVLFFPEGDARAGNPVTISVDTWEAPLFVRGAKSFPSLSVDEDTTRADEEAVLAGARMYLRKQLIDGEILVGGSAVLSALKVTQEEDRKVWQEAIRGSGGSTFTRMRGLRKYAAG